MSDVTKRQLRGGRTIAEPVACRKKQKVSILGTMNDPEWYQEHRPFISGRNRKKVIRPFAWY
jgi:hypothetical protein